ncbi:MAG: carbonic anhydrase [Leptolyngbyaceae cyanobacterium HOT.MB2.61]|nr:carbonic anhydrase [Leptolyngbyaceae cyanobacterium HOT.MB2.61]
MNQVYGLIGRRNFLRLMGVMGSGMAGTIAGLTWNTHPAHADEGLSPDSALQQLLAGNQRFVWHKPDYPHQSAKRLQEVASAQHPFATVLSCADSRVPVELIFDAGVGDLFDIRVAGNIVTPEVLGSLEYAAALLGTPLIMVLGHEHCGAVTAAVQNEPLPGSIGSLVKAIKPAVGRVKETGNDRVELAVVENVRYQIERMQQKSPVLTQLVAAGKLKVVGGRYDLDTGEVTLV